MNTLPITISLIKLLISMDRLAFTVHMAKEHQDDAIERLERMRNDIRYKTGKAYDTGYCKNIKVELPACNRKGLKKVTTSVIISLKPYKKKKGQNHKFVRVEHNPSQLSWKGHQILHRILLKILGTECFNSIQTEARITIMDITVDIFNHTPEDFWYMIPKSKCGGIYINRDGQIGTIYTGSNRSRFKLRTYEKMKEHKDNGRFIKQVPGMPKTLLRLEACLNDTKFHIQDANSIPNPFGKIKLFKPVNKVDGVTPCFFDSVRFRGLKNALNLLPKEERKLMDKALKTLGITTLSNDNLWSHWDAIVDQSLFSLLSAHLYKERLEHHMPVWVQSGKARRPKKKSKKRFTRSKTLLTSN